MLNNSCFLLRIFTFSTLMMRMLNMVKSIPLLAALLLFQPLLAQKEGNIWYFGQQSHGFEFTLPHLQCCETAPCGNNGENLL
jgi:hypothetical protein